MQQAALIASLSPSIKYDPRTPLYILLQRDVRAKQVIKADDGQAQPRLAPLCHDAAAEAPPATGAAMSPQDVQVWLDATMQQTMRTVHEVVSSALAALEPVVAAGITIESLAAGRLKSLAAPAPSSSPAPAPTPVAAASTKAPAPAKGALAPASTPAAGESPSAAHGTVSHNAISLADLPPAAVKQLLVRSLMTLAGLQATDCCWFGAVKLLSAADTLIQQDSTGESSAHGPGSALALSVPPSPSTGTVLLHRLKAAEGLLYAGNVETALRIVDGVARAASASGDSIVLRRARLVQAAAHSVDGNVQEALATVEGLVLSSSSTIGLACSMDADNAAGEQGDMFLTGTALVAASTDLAALSRAVGVLAQLYERTGSAVHAQLRDLVTRLDLPDVTHAQALSRIAQKLAHISLAAVDVKASVRNAFARILVHPTSHALRDRSHCFEALQANRYHSALAQQLAGVCQQAGDAASAIAAHVTGASHFDGVRLALATLALGRSMLPEGTIDASTLLQASLAEQHLLCALRLAQLYAPLFPALQGEVCTALSTLYFSFAASPVSVASGASALLSGLRFFHLGGRARQVAGAWRSGAVLAHLDSMPATATLPAPDVTGKGAVKAAPGKDAAAPVVAAPTSAASALPAALEDDLRFTHKASVVSALEATSAAKRSSSRDAITHAEEAAAFVPTNADRVSRALSILSFSASLLGMPTTSLSDAALRLATSVPTDALATFRVDAHAALSDASAAISSGGSLVKHTASGTMLLLDHHDHATQQLDELAGTVACRISPTGDGTSSVKLAFAIVPKPSQPAAPTPTATPTATAAGKGPKSEPPKPAAADATPAPAVAPADVGPAFVEVLRPSHEVARIVALLATAAREVERARDSLLARAQADAFVIAPGPAHVEASAAATPADKGGKQAKPPAAAKSAVPAVDTAPARSSHWTALQAQCAPLLAMVWEMLLHNPATTSGSSSTLPVLHGFPVDAAEVDGVPSQCHMVCYLARLFAEGGHAVNDSHLATALGRIVTRMQGLEHASE